MRNAAHVFTDLEDDARSVKPSYYFMMRSLLHSRIDTGFLSNQETEDEDVNVYLAHLLKSLGDTTYLAEARPYLHKYDHEVFYHVNTSPDPRLKYQVYKANADFLLVSMGVFDNPSQALLNQLPGHPSGGRHKELEPSPDAVLARGRTYYRFAHTYSQVVNRRNPGITDVLGKLSEGFDRYVRLLTHLRSEYMDLVHALSRGEMFHLEQSLNQEQKAECLRSAQDNFLDVYAEWRRHRSSAKFKALMAAVETVRKWDPHFEFNPET